MRDTLHESAQPLLGDPDRCCRRCVLTGLVAQWSQRCVCGAASGRPLVVLSATSLLGERASLLPICKRALGEAALQQGLCTSPRQSFWESSIRRCLSSFVGFCSGSRVRWCWPPTDRLMRCGCDCRSSAHRFSHAGSRNPGGAVEQPAARRHGRERAGLMAGARQSLFAARRGHPAQRQRDSQWSPDRRWSSSAAYAMAAAREAIRKTAWQPLW